MSARPVRFRVVPREEGMMLGHLLARRLPDTDVARGRALVMAGAVYMGQVRVRVPTVRVLPGERITVYPEGLDARELDPDSLRIVHRDPAFVILDKPAGVPVAATRSTARGTLSEAMRRLLEGEGIVRPYVGVVHRLDQGASGLVLMTIRGVANKSLHQQFVDHRIARTYRVLVHGEAPEAMEHDAPLAPRAGGGSRIAEAGEPRGKPALTRFRRLAPRRALPGTSLLEVELVTGRTHQIRVHAAGLGLPVVGDRRYGRDDDDAGRLHLHAWRLDFVHPVDGSAVQAVADLPPWAR